MLTPLQPGVLIVLTSDPMPRHHRDTERRLCLLRLQFRRTDTTMQVDRDDVEDLLDRLKRGFTDVQVTHVGSNPV